MEKPKPLKQLASPMSEIVMRKLPKGLDLDQAALLSFFLSLHEGVRRRRSHCSVSFRDPELPCNVDIGMLTSWDATPTERKTPDVGIAAFAPAGGFGFSSAS